jgi:predicted N-acetyltransferase YhbS
MRDEIRVNAASAPDADEILALQKLAYESEARLYDDWSIPPLTQSIESLRDEFTHSVVLKAVMNDRIVGSVRARETEGICAIGRLIVAPDMQGRGLGTSLMQAIEAAFQQATAYELFTGSRSVGNIRLYERLGYVQLRTEVLSPTVSLVFMRK